jgi:DNA polymerase-3 subunit gamma/tau
MAKQQSPSSADESYTVLARRYRPQTFDELVGQEATARALVNALKGNRVAHAYLFTGPRGVGKTSTARILAKALNCEKGPTPTPCNECDICRSITAGDDVDVIEIDGASNRRIDEIRDIRANVQYSPTRARYKIYIIDEVHMLTKEAFNALLKTLEEPPPHVKFIFATTEVQKIPITILSRCQRFDFAGIPTDRILDLLKTITEREGMPADDDALELVARRAGGSMRDAQSLLDQLLAFGGDRLTADQVRQLLGMADDDGVLALAKAVVQGDAAQALAVLDQTAQGGLQMGELVDQLLAYWRDLMVVHCAGEQARDLTVPSRGRPDLTRHAGSMTLDAVLAGLDVLSAARFRLRDSSHGRTLVEMALVRLCRISDLLPVAQLAQMIAQASPAQTVPHARGEGREGGGRATVAPPEGVKKKRLSSAVESASAAPSCPDPPGADATRLSSAPPESMPDIWSQILRSVGPLLASDLEKGGIPAIIGPNSLVLRFPADYNQSREYCQEPSRLARIEEALRKATGRPWTVRVEAATGTPSPPLTVAAPTPLAQRRNARAEAEKEPLVQRAVEVLGAQIVRVDEGFAAAGRPAQTTAEES